MELGFMQGRFSPPVNGLIQAFPWDHWESEFMLGQSAGFSCMEWTLDQHKLYENPLMSSHGRKKIKALCNKFHITIRSITGDCFMQAPFWKTNGNERKSLLSDLQYILEACTELNISFLVIPLVDAGGIENTIQEENLLEGLSTVHNMLGDANLKIIFESDFPPHDLLFFINKMNPQWFGINYDIGNSAALGYDPSIEIPLYAHRILNVHVKDRLLGGTTVPLGTGAADLPTVFKLLKENGYVGQYILQTARAKNEDHYGVMVQYRDHILAISG